jgi:hypothetical protein
MFCIVRLSLDGDHALHNVSYFRQNFFRSFRRVEDRQGLTPLKFRLGGNNSFAGP